MNWSYEWSAGMAFLYERAANYIGQDVQCS